MMQWAAKGVVVGALLAAVARPGSANADMLDPVPGPVYLRFDLGVARSTFKNGQAPPEARTVVAVAPVVTAAVGFRFVPALAIYVESFNQFITSHEVEEIGADNGLGRFQSLGLGMVWTIPSIGVQLAETVAKGWASVPSEKGGNATIDGSGFMSQTRLGKDWQVSPRWRCGGSAELAYGTMPGWTSLILGLLFSATYG